MMEARLTGSRAGRRLLAAFQAFEPLVVQLSDTGESADVFPVLRCHHPQLRNIAGQHFYRLGEGLVAFGEAFQAFVDGHFFTPAVATPTSNIAEYVDFVDE